MTDEEEKRMFDKYIRPGRHILSRIKTRLMVLMRSDRIKTIKDVEYLDYELLIKTMCFLMLVACARTIFDIIWDVYLFFFPGVRPPDPDIMTPYIVPLIAKTLRGALHV